MGGLLQSLEKWASESDERMRLVVILVWVGLGVLVVATVIAMYLLTRPQAVPLP